MTWMSKRNVVEQRWKGREMRTRETHQRRKRIADGERSQDTPSGYAIRVRVRALVGTGVEAGSIGMIGVGAVTVAEMGMTEGRENKNKKNTPKGEKKIKRQRAEVERTGDMNKKNTPKDQQTKTKKR